MFKFVNFSSLCRMKYMTFLYINANKKFVLLEATAAPVEKRSS